MILIKNLKKSFNNRPVIDDLSLELPSNKLVFIVGKSGIGKSTILKLIGGYEKPDSGTIDFIGYDNFDFKNIDFVFQDFNLIKGLTALENLQIGVNVLGVKFDKQKALEILNKIDINNDLSKQKIENLSGGEQQRVAIARSILRNSQILLTDEPTGNLDFNNSKIIFKFLKEISQTKTVIVVTHDIKNAKEYGDYIVEIKKEGIEQYELNQPIETQEAFKTPTLSSFKYQNSNKLKLIPKFLKNDLKRKVIQMILIVLAFVATVITFGSLMSFKSAVDYNNSYLSSSFLQTDRITVRKKDDNNYFSKNELDSFSKLPKLKYMSKNYGIFSFSFSHGDKKSIDPTVRFIDFNEFYKQRNIRNVSQGTFPTKDDEIIISKNLASTLGIDPKNAIGQTITMHVDSTAKANLKIVAVNDQNDFTGQNLSFVSNELIKKIEEKFLSASNKIELLVDIKKGERDKSFTGDYTSIKNIPSSEIIKSDVKINDEYPKIWLSKNLVNAGKLKLNDTFGTIFRRRLLNFTLAGVINTDNSTIALSQKAIDEYSQVEIYRVSLYFDDSVDTSKYAEELSQEPQYRNLNFFGLQKNSFIEQFNSGVKGILLTFQIIVGLLILISILFTLGFTKILNDYKKGEIGLLKSLSSSLKQTLTYHVSYFVVINIIVLIFSLSLFVPFQIAFNTFFDRSGTETVTSVSNYAVGFEYLILMWAINFIITTSIYSLFSYVKFRKQVNNLIN